MSEFSRFFTEADHKANVDKIELAHGAMYKREITVVSGVKLAKIIALSGYNVAYGNFVILGSERRIFGKRLLARYQRAVPATDWQAMHPSGREALKQIYGGQTLSNGSKACVVVRNRKGICYVAEIPDGEEPVSVLQQHKALGRYLTYKA